MVYMGTVLFPSFFNTSIQYSWLLLNKIFFALVSRAFLIVHLVLLFVYIVVTQWKKKRTASNVS